MLLRVYGGQIGRRDALAEPVSRHRFGKADARRCASLSIPSSSTIWVRVTSLRIDLVAVTWRLGTVP